MSLSSSAYLDFDTFFEESRPDMLARALMLSRSRHDAEDAVQEAYVEALSRWDRLASYDNPGAWVYKIVRQRLWKSSGRWNRLRSLGSDEAITLVEERHGDPERFTEAGMVLSALAGLPDRQRMVMIMHCLHHMGQQQIADELGLSRGAVAASIFKARRKLEKALGLTDTSAEPGSLITEFGPDPTMAITRRRDPLAAALDEVLARLRQVVSDNEGWLDRVHREAHARARQPGHPQ